MRILTSPSRRSAHDDIESVQRYKLEQIPGIDRDTRPEFLYKYLSLGTKDHVLRARQGIEKHQLWMSCRERFNDPFDSRPSIDLSADKRAKIEWMATKYMEKGRFASIEDATARACHIIDNSEGKEAALSKEIEIQIMNHLNDVGILCLAGSRDSLLMWSHYADSHKGLCLEFRSQDEGDLFDAARTVTYQREYPSIRAFIDGESEKFMKALLVKSDCWGYEREYRVLDPKRCNYLVEYDQNNLVSVVFGAFVDPSIRDAIIESSQRTEPMLKYLQARLAHGEFRLVFDAIG